MNSNLKSWSTIPQELLDRIFQGLEVGDYKQCQRICRNWSESARKYFYKSTKLTSASQASAFVQATSTPSTKVRASQLVESLELNKEICKYPSVDSVLPLVLASCPNVTKLWTSKQKGPFWTKLLQEYYEGHCSHLAYLPHAKPTFIDTIQSYGYCIWAMRNTLKEICIYDYPTPEEGYKFKNQREVNQLDQYVALEKLCAYIKTIENTYQLPSIIRKNQQIKSLELVIDTYNVSRDMDDDVADDDSVNNLFADVNFDEDGNMMENDDDSVGDLLGGMHYINLETSPEPLPNIKILRCEKLMPVNNGFINYLINVFTGLESLHININEEFDKYPRGDDERNFMMPNIEKVFERKMEMEGNNVSSELWVELLTHVYTNIPSFTLSHLFVADIPAVLDLFMEAVNFSGTLDFRYKIDQTTSILLEPYIGIYSKVDGIYFGRKEIDHKDGNINVVFDASFGCYNDTLPHMDIIEQLGEKVKSLEIDIHEGDRLAEEGTQIHKMVTGQFLDHAFRTCPLLDSLCIRSAHLMTCSPFPQINNALKVLRLWNCSVVPNVLSEISVRLPSLTHLIMNNCFVATPEYFCPAVNDNKNLTIDMPHTSLDTFYWSVSLGIYDSTKFFLRVSKRDGQEVLHFTGDNNNVTRAPAKHFQDSLEDDSVLSIHICCADVKTVMIFTPTIRLVIKLSQGGLKFRPLTKIEETHNFVKVLNKRFRA